MIPLRIAGANVVYRGNGEDVRDLHVRVTEGHCVSRWEPTPSELAILNAGGSVELWVQGPQPPVMLQAAPMEAPDAQGGGNGQ